MLYFTIEEFAISLPKNFTKLLAIDYGQKKIGIAFGDRITKLATPLTNIANNQQQLVELTKIFAAYNIKALIVGLPNMDKDNEANIKIIKFAEMLVRKFNCNILMYHESYSSKIADTKLKDLGFSRKKRNAIDDQVAAMVILEEVLLKL